jgi:hypothetical protein
MHHAPVDALQEAEDLAGVYRHSVAAEYVIWQDARHEATAISNSIVRSQSWITRAIALFLPGVLVAAYLTFNA